MGLRLRKSFKLPGGFRINVSARGVGASWGVPGFRIGTGPSGTRVHAGIPGTGIGWTTGFGARASGSSHVSRYQHTLAAQREAERYAELERNRYEVQLHEQRLQALTSLHHEGWSPWNWAAIAALAPPQAPIRQHFLERQACQRLESFQPSVLGKLLGAESKRQQLEAAVVHARALDEQEYSSLYHHYENEYRRWEWFQRLSCGILAGDPEACQTAIDCLGPFNTFSGLGSSLNVAVTRSWCVEGWVTANDQRVVPTESLSLTATGKVSRRTLPGTKYWAIYQDHVCSAALRVAREIFALLPVPISLVHIAYPWTNTRTGLPDTYSILSVAFDRETFDTLRLDSIDPSDSMANFEHRMSYKKTSGFDPIDPLTPDDLTVEDQAQQSNPTR